jgi:hypothetical protein
VAGYRYHRPNLSLVPSLGAASEFLPEPDNPKDPGAVEIRTGGERIGYVNRLQAPTFLHWLRTRQVSAQVERLNGTAEDPRIFLFVRVRPGSDPVAHQQ